MVFIYLFVCLFIYLFTYLFMFVYVFVYVFIYLLMLMLVGRDMELSGICLDDPVVSPVSSHRRDLSP